jgi:cation transporter-like permease
VPRTLTSREHPGTAVLWDGQWFEVVGEERSTTEICYVLAPWPENHAIRISDTYDGASEVRREGEHNAALRREKNRTAANLLGMFTGQLPASVQEQLASELGLLAPRLTLLSLIPQFAFIVAAVLSTVSHVVDHTGGPKLGLAVLTIYFTIENLIRFNIAFNQGRPIGSAIGMLIYSVGYIFGLRKAGGASPVQPIRGTAIYKTEAPPDIAIRDAVRMRAPLMTLLSVPEQEMLERQYGYDYREPAAVVATIILFSSIAGIVTSMRTLSHGPSISALVSLLVAAVLAAEQAYRLYVLRQRPAGSILAFLVRPFMRKLLSR